MNRYFKKIFSVILFFLFSSLLAEAQTVHVDKIINMGPPINTSDADFSPSLTADGKIMVFNSKRGRSKYQKIYISLFQDNAWTNPRQLNEINSKYNDESPYITPDGSYIFFSSDRDGSFELPADSMGNILVSYDIYVSKKIGDRWDTPIKLPGAVNTVHHERTPSLSLDSSILYYTSMPFGDVSKAQIMKADYKDGEFVNPVALPYPVNANAQDMCLVPSPDGKGFYFSSRRSGGSGGAGGYGGWDIYYSKFENGIFKDPVNLGNQINSDKNETNLCLVGDSIYFCSDREGGYGSNDIYTTKISVSDNNFIVIVRDKKTKKPLQTEVYLKTTVKENDDKSLTYEIRKKTNENGEANVDYNPKVKDLDVVIDKDGYLPLFDKINIQSLNSKPAILELTPIEKEASFAIHAIHFDFESSKIKPESYPYLDSLADYLKKHPSMQFEIIGHTDLHGTDEFNDKLSLDRAGAVRDYLANKGLDKNRFTIKGYGKRQPLVPEINPETDEQNRRTEFKLMDNTKAD